MRVIPLCALIVITSTALGLQVGFAEVTSVPDWYFYYHDFDQLLLTVGPDGCYFISFDNPDMVGCALSSDSRSRTEDFVYRQIINQRRIVKLTSLQSLRDRFEDLLADFHCIDKTVYSLLLKEDDLIREGIMTDYTCITGNV